MCSLALSSGLVLPHSITLRGEISIFDAAVDHIFDWGRVLGIVWNCISVQIDREVGVLNVIGS